MRMPELQNLQPKPARKVIKVFDSDIFKGCTVGAQTENFDSVSAKEAVSQEWISKKIMLYPAVPSHSFSKNAAGANYSIHHMTNCTRPGFWVKVLWIPESIILIVQFVLPLPLLFILQE